MNSAERNRFIEATHRHPARPRVYCFGDSWFQLPFAPRDLHKQVRTELRNECIVVNNSVAGRETAAIKRNLDQLRRDLSEWEIDVLLISMGGNDIVGDELAEFLKPAAEAQSAAVPAGTPQVVADHVRLKAFSAALDFVLDDLTRIVEIRDRASPQCHVVFNTYAYPIPDGRRFGGRGLFSSGPWMQPHMHNVGLDDLDERKALARWLIDRFFEALAARIDDGRWRDCHVVDSRASLPSASDWGDEIHPTKAGFGAISRQHWLPLIRRLLP